jgi:hypothetical protein
MKSEKDRTANQNVFRVLNSIIFLTILLTAAILGAAISVSIFDTKSVYADNNWYLGKGVKSGVYFTYRIQDHDTMESQPFIMTIYFKQYDSKNQYWIAPVYVVDPTGKVINGTFHLSNLDLSALGTSQIPPAMVPYRGAYVDSLDWLASFVPKPGLSLSAPYWGKIAAIGGSAVAPNGSSKITVPAGTFDTTVVSWHYGVDNFININPNLPYPVKAQTFAAVTAGNPPIQFAFDLQAMGQGPPSIPKSHVQIPKPPLTIQTARGTYYIELLWQPETIVHGKDTRFGILFMDSSKSIVDQISYSFKIATISDGKAIKDLHDQKASDGTGEQVVDIPQDGPFNVVVSVDAVGGLNTGDFIESSTFNLDAT